MKNWNFSLRDGNDGFNMDFETNEPAKVGSKLNDFFAGLLYTTVFLSFMSFPLLIQIGAFLFNKMHGHRH